MFAARIVCCRCCLPLAVCAASFPRQLIFVTAFVYEVLETAVVARVYPQHSTHSTPRSACEKILFLWGFSLVVLFP